MLVDSSVANALLRPSRNITEWRTSSAYSAGSTKSTQGPLQRLIWYCRQDGYGCGNNCPRTDAPGTPSAAERGSRGSLPHWDRGRSSALLLLRTTMDAQAWIGAIREMHIGVGLVIAQEDVVRRSPLLDQGLLEQQRLGLVGGDGGLDLRDLCNQRGSLGRQPGLAEIAGEALLEVLRLADIEQLAALVEHPVDTRTPTAGGKEITCVENVGHLS